LAVKSIARTCAPRPRPPGRNRNDDLLAGRFDAILDRWRAKAATSSGAFVSWTTADGVVSGQTVGIDLDGALLVRRGDAIERIVAGEVNWMDR
jgi:biotin-(acetyl-CoA carboxylase) ligase